MSSNGLSYSTSVGHALRPPQRIVILCDGTMQHREDITEVLQDGTYVGTRRKWYTNVAMLARCIETASSTPDILGGNKPQIMLYQLGIGTWTYANLISSVFTAATGGAFSDQLAQAMAFLVDNYQDGDEVFLFGFSRGAYTVRAIANFLNFAGILSKDEHYRSFAKVWSAFHQRRPRVAKSVKHAEEVCYQELKRWPSGNSMRSARTGQLARSEIGEDDLYTQRDLESGQVTHDTVRKYPRCTPLRIRVVGVWDTVGSLGLPGTFAKPGDGHYLDFFNPTLTPNIDRAFHALALAEDRKDFLQTMWHVPPSSHDFESDRVRRSQQVLKQVWFPGSHSDVGGGFSPHGLSDVTLAWMVSQLLDDKEGPLLNVDVERLKVLQDRRKGWGREPEQPSRWCVEFYSPRNVGSAGFEEGRETFESIHHSVHISGRYSIASRQFKKLIKYSPAIFEDMWNSSQDVDSLGPTEKRLAWYPITTRSGDGLISKKDVLPDRGSPSVKRIKKIALWPIDKALGTVQGAVSSTTFLGNCLLNLRIVATDNLRPSYLEKGINMSVRR